MFTWGFWLLFSGWILKEDFCFVQLAFLGVGMLLAARKEMWGQEDDMGRRTVLRRKMNYRKAVKLIKSYNSRAKWKLKQENIVARNEIQYFMLIIFLFLFLVKNGQRRPNPQNPRSWPIPAPPASGCWSVVPCQDISPSWGPSGTLCLCNSSNCGLPLETAVWFRWWWVFWRLLAWFDVFAFRLTDSIWCRGSRSYP